MPVFCKSNFFAQNKNISLKKIIIKSNLSLDFLNLLDPNVPCKVFLEVVLRVETQSKDEEDMLAVQVCLGG